MTPSLQPLKTLMTPHFHTLNLMLSLFHDLLHSTRKLRFFARYQALQRIYIQDVEHIY